MIEIKANYWPNTPHLRELKIYINTKYELGYFADYIEITSLISELVKIREDLIKDNKV